MTPCSPPTPNPPMSNKSGRMVHCVKFQKDLPGLDEAPWPGELGQRLYESVSRDAAASWSLADRFHRRNITAAYAELEWED